MPLTLCMVLVWVVVAGVIVVVVVFDWYSGVDVPSKQQAELLKVCSSDSDRYDKQGGTVYLGPDRIQHVCCCTYTYTRPTILIIHAMCANVHQFGEHTCISMCELPACSVLKKLFPELH